MGRMIPDSVILGEEALYRYRHPGQTIERIYEKSQEHLQIELSFGEYDGGPIEELKQHKGIPDLHGKEILHIVER